MVRGGYKNEYTLGIDVGTGGARAGIFDLKGRAVIFSEEPFALYTPHSGWAEQNPQDWWNAVCKASRRAISESGVSSREIIGIGLDATCCTVVATDRELNPLRPAVMWMDVRSMDQAARISQTGHEALKYNGFGEVSAEFFPCKALWLKENEPELYRRTAYMMESTEWLCYMLTGELALSMNTTTMRWYYDNSAGGWNRDFYECIGLEDVLEKLPKDVLPVGTTLGKLKKHAAEQMGLVPGIPVGEGISDAHAGMIGLNVVQEGRTAIITGSSHLHEGLTKVERHGRGFFGTFPDAIIPGLHLIEGGQVSTGSIINWFKTQYCGSYEEEARTRGVNLYTILEEKSRDLEPGCEGLIVLDYFQGNRTPLTDAKVRGMIYGLSLNHRPEHIFRAMIEGICYGTEHIFRTFEQQGFRPAEVYMSGGATKNRLWVQTHADVSNVPIFLPEVKEAPCLGSAILGAVAGGTYTSIPEAAGNMVIIADKIEPDKERHEAYRFYAEKYMEVHPLLKDWMHGITDHIQKGHKTEKGGL